MWIFKREYVSFLFVNKNNSNYNLTEIQIDCNRTALYLLKRSNKILQNIKFYFETITIALKSTLIILRNNKATSAKFSTDGVLILPF